MTEEAIQRTVLPNGIRVISEKVSSVYSVALGFWITAGSNNETEEQNGLAHLLEHMTFKGTHTRTNFQIANEIESLGGVINAFTGKNITCYYVHLLHEHLAKGIEVLADLIQNATLSEEELEKEKGVIIEEIRDVEDTPGDAIHDYFDRQVFPQHPLGRPIQGSVESVAALTRVDLVDFMSQHYAANRLVVVATGNVDHADLVELVAKTCSGIQRINLPDHNTPLPSIEKQKQIWHRNINQAHVILGRRIFPQSDPRRFHLALLNTILSGGMTSRLFHNIRDRFGSVYEIYSFTDLYLESGVFGIYAGVETGKINAITELIYHELFDLRDNGIPEAELQKVKQQAKSSLVLSLENMYARMSRLAKMDIFENHIFQIPELLQIIDNISLDDLQALMTYLFQRDKFIETFFLPKNNHEDIRE